MTGEASSASRAASIGEEFAVLMDVLSAAIAAETAAVAGGRLREAATVWERKAEVAGRYLAEVVRFKQVTRTLTPAERAKLAQRQHEFRTVLEKNLAVLATAHAVSEGLIRGAAAEVTRKAAPDTYGARGRALPPPARAAQPVAISRSF